MSALFPVTTFSGGAASFHVDGMEVLVRGGDNNRGAATLAEALTDHAAAVLAANMRAVAWERKYEEALNRIDQLETKLADARARVPETPARLLGEACVRFHNDGTLWLLNKRETGWASFGLRIDGGWDELFRRFDARVTGHGVDKNGPYWIVTPAGRAALEASR